MRPTGECTLVERIAAQGSFQRLSNARGSKCNCKDWSGPCLFGRGFLQAKRRSDTLNPQDFLGPLSDALSFVGHAGYQTSLKRRYLLKPEFSKGFQLLCATSTLVTTQLFGDDLSKNVDDISKANKIATKFTSIDRGDRYTKYRRTTGARVPFLSKPSQSRTRRNYDRTPMQSRRTQFRHQPKTSAAQGLHQTN